MSEQNLVAGSFSQFSPLDEALVAQTAQLCLRLRCETFHAAGCCLLGGWEISENRFIDCMAGSFIGKARLFAIDITKFDQLAENVD